PGRRAVAGRRAPVRRRGRRRVRRPRRRARPGPRGQRRRRSAAHRRRHGARGLSLNPRERGTLGEPVRLGTSLILIAVGAILAYAVTWSPSALDLQTAGSIV